MDRPYVGKVGGAKPRPMLRRLFEKMEVTATCWLWRGGINDSGYAVFWDGKRFTYAHRLSYELFVGDVPEGLTIDHLCGNARCIRPDHLEPVSHRENLQRAWRRRKSA